MKLQSSFVPVNYLERWFLMNNLKKIHSNLVKRLLVLRLKPSCAAQNCIVLNTVYSKTKRLVVKSGVQYDAV